MWARLIFCFLTLFLISALNAQEPDFHPGKDQRALRFVQKGQEALLQHEYEKAKEFFARALKLNYHSSAATRGMAKTYELLGKYSLAASFYDEFLLMNPNYANSIFFEAAHAHYMTGNYRRALDLFFHYQKLQSSPAADFGFEGDLEYQKHQLYIQELEDRIQMCVLALDSFQFSAVQQIRNLGPGINTKGDEYFPYLTNNQELLFYTARENQFADEDLYVSEWKTGSWQPGVRVANAFNTSQNEGMSTLVRNGRKVFFTACKRRRVDGPCDIWQADLEGKSVKNLDRLPGEANSSAWESQASISCDGKTLFFASNREGGFGGTDIWMSRLQENGAWAPPVNLGPMINTPKDEEAPFISNDGNTLYFSSTGHSGFGEEDIFFSRQETPDCWTAPLNLGQPVNSSYRELGFYLSADGRTGYFASNREGGQGGMDIYQFQLPQELYSDPITFLEITVTDSLTQKPVMTKVYFPDQTLQTDQEGRLFLCLPAPADLSFTILESIYKPYYQSLEVPTWDNSVFFSVPVKLLPSELHPGVPETPDTSKVIQTVSLKYTVYFEFDQAELSLIGKREIKQFLDRELGGREVLEVDIVGYSDQIGSNAYNLVLSEKRAKAVALFLKEAGIRVDRILLEGAGELLEAIPDREKRKVDIFLEVLE